MGYRAILFEIIKIKTCEGRRALDAVPRDAEVRRLKRPIAARAPVRLAADLRAAGCGHAQAYLLPRPLFKALDPALVTVLLY